MHCVYVMYNVSGGMPMYTVLLATDQKEIADNFSRFDGWERLGYSRPIIAETCDDASAALSAGSVDAVSVALPTKESARLHDRLHGLRMLFLEPAADKDSLEEVLRKMTVMIERQYEPKPEASMLASIRDTFFQTLLDGLMHSETVLRNRLQVLKLPICPDHPCVLYTLALDNAEQYLGEIWQYGKARLQLALRKFLAAECDGLYCALGNIRAGAVRLICCPVMRAEQMPESELEAKADECVSRGIERVSDYLELPLKISSRKTLPGLTSLLIKPGR